MRKFKMIVINKSTVSSAFCILPATILCIAGVAFTARKRSITAFSDFRPVLESGIAGISGKDGDEFKGIAERVHSMHKSIIKNIFLINETEDFKQNYEEIGVEEKKELSVPEVRRVIRGLELSNATDYNVDPNDYLARKLAFSLDSQGVEVLIVHTHTTESFCDEGYEKNAPDRDLDEAKNIVAVGDAMAEVFEKGGISVFHDKTVHDYPSYNGAYQRAAATIKKDMEAYPGIKVVLDVHRDAIVKEDGTRVKLLTDIGGIPTAQIMLVVGTNSNLEHSNWQENFTFAAKIQAKAIEMYPTLMRQINLRKERFNEQLTLGSLIVEVGTNGNTVEEAKQGGRCIAEVIKNVLKESE